MKPTFRWPYPFVVVAPLILFAPFLLGQQVLYWGTPLLQFYPWRQLALDTLRAGHLPLWNPWVGNGAPLLANYQSAIFYPPNGLSLFLPLDYSLSWLAVLHLIWPGVGMVLLARTLGLKPVGQVVAGLAFGLAQYLVARVGFLSINAAAAWVPWVVWAVENLLKNRDATSTVQTKLPYSLALTACVAMQLLAGHAQTTWYTGVLAAMWAVWRFRQTSTRQSPGIAPAVFLLSFSFLLALLIAGIQLLPTAELLRQSPRATAAEYEFVMTYSFSPWRLLTLLAPDVLGNPARGQFIGYGNYWEDAIYIGVLPVLLALGQVAKIRLPVPGRVSSPQSSLVRFLALVSLIALALALGRNTPLFPFLYDHVPTFNLFQAPTRWMIVFEFALALLAGVGADHWQRPQGKALYWTRLGAAGAMAVIIIGMGVWLAVSPTTKLAAQFNTVARALTFTGVGLLGCATLALLKPVEENSVAHRRWEWAVGVFLAADLLVAHWGLNPGAPPTTYSGISTTGTALKAAIGEQRVFQFPADEHAVKFELLSFQTFGPPSVAADLRQAQVPVAGMLDGVATANNFDPLIPARYADLLAVLSDTQSLNLLRLMNVGAVGSPAALSWPIITASPVITFYRVPAEAHRVWIVDTAQTVPNAEAARAAIADPAFDPAQTVILEADDVPEMLIAQQLPTPITPSPNVEAFSVTLARAGWVVLADTYYPGWGAFVDSRPVPIHRANYAFRAVAVEAGEHTLTFVYQPRSVVWGAWLTGVGLGVWLFLIIGSVWMRRSRS